MSDMTLREKIEREIRKQYGGGPEKGGLVSAFIVSIIESEGYRKVADDQVVVARAAFDRVYLWCPECEGTGVDHILFDDNGNSRTEVPCEFCEKERSRLAGAKVRP